jgi:hypothetical protein
MRATLSPVFRPKGRVAVPERSTRAPTTIAAIAGKQDVRLSCFSPKRNRSEAGQGRNTRVDPAWVLLLVVRPCRARLSGIQIEQLRSVGETDLMHARDWSAVLGGV